MHRPVTASPAEIFFRILDRLEDQFHAVRHARKFRDYEIATRMRNELFNLEGWAKVFQVGSSHSERRVFSKIRGLAKELEDALGAVTLAIDIARDLRSRDEETIALQFDQSAERAYRKAKAILKKRDWFDSRVRKIRSSLGKIGWPTTDKQTHKLVRVLRDECLRLESRYRKELRPPLLQSHYSKEVLETKFHKFRRQLRWISMYFQIAEGMIALQPVPKKMSLEDRKLVQFHKDDPFAVLPNHFKSVAHIDAVAFYELTRLIEILGKAKDPAERYYQIIDLNGDVDLASSIYGDAPEEVPKKAHEILKEYERKNPLKSLAASLMEQR